MKTDDARDLSVLVTWPGFKPARTTTGALPRILPDIVATDGVKAERGATDGNDVGRRTGIGNAGAVARRSKVNDVSRCEQGVHGRFGGELTGAKAHRNLTTTCRAHQIAGNGYRTIKVGEGIWLRLHQIESSQGRHGMSPFDVQ